VIGSAVVSVEAPKTGVTIIKTKELQKWTTNVIVEGCSKTPRTESAATTAERTSMGNTHTDPESVIEQKNAREDDNLLSGGISRSDRSSLVKLPLSGVEITGEVIRNESITSADLKANLECLSLSAENIRPAQSSHAELRDEEGISVGKLEINKEVVYPDCTPSSALPLRTTQFGFGGVR